MLINWIGETECYRFDTGLIFGSIAPYTGLHGINGLMHQEEKVNIVKPGLAFLNAEYYFRPGHSLRMVPRDISLKKQTSHEICEDTVIIHFPPEPEYAVNMDLAYRPYEDVVDLQMTLSPTKDIPGFEIFFASYVCEVFNETWVPLKDIGGLEEWVKLANRQVISDIFCIVRNKEMGAAIAGRWGPPSKVKVENKTFSKPILVARNSVNGLTLIFMCDHLLTNCLAGQYHGWDTAHDWFFSSDLVKSRQIVARVRMVYRRFRDTSLMFNEISELWEYFERDSSCLFSAEQ